MKLNVVLLRELQANFKNLVNYTVTWNGENEFENIVYNNPKQDIKNLKNMESGKQKIISLNSPEEIIKQVKT